jgi:AcrR family transcriptional regulator
MQDVAAAADLHRATLYRHFADREHLVRAVLEQALTEATAAVQATEDPTPGWAAVRRATVALVEVGLQYLGLVGGFATDDPDLVQREAGLQAALQRIVSRAQEAGAVRDGLDPRWVTTCLLQLLAAAAEEVRAGRLEPDAVADLVLATLRHGVGAHAGADGRTGPRQEEAR